MTQLKSWRMIGVDFKGVEHSYEQPAYTGGEAGRKLAANHGNLVRAYVDCSKLRGKPTGEPRKLVWVRPGHEEEVKAMGFGVMQEAMSKSRIDVAEMIVKNFEKRGLRIVVETDKTTNTTDIFITPSGKATDADRREIEEHKDTLIAFLKQRESTEEINDQSNEPEDQREGDGKVSLRETIRRILPDLPHEFSITDVQKQLRSWKDQGYDDLANNVKSLHNLLHWVVQEGFVSRAKRGRYILLDKALLPRRSTEATADMTDVVPPESLETGAPPEPPKLPPAAALPATPLEPGTPEKSEPIPISTTLLQATAPVQDALIRLAADLGSGSIDDSTIDRAEKAINDVLGAWEAMTNALAPLETVLRRVREINANKSQLLKTFSGLKLS